MPTIWEEIKGRKIFKAATLYAAVTWGTIQIADILLPVLNYPDWVMSSMVLIAFSGFPIALLLGWMLDMKNERARAAQIDDTETRIGPLASRLIEISIITIFGITAILLYINTTNQPVKANIGDMPSVEELTAENKNQKTIAVLPFASFGSSEDDVYFADGLSEELLNVLAKNSNLRVAARTSSFQYKNQNINIKTIAKELGVQYILEGSVRRSGDQIRVTAQLIKADEDIHVFSSTWDRDTSNIFKVQDEIAQSVMEQLEVKLLAKKTRIQYKNGTEDIAAFAEHSRGVAYLRNRTEEDFEQAIIHFNSAIAIDEHYAEAYAMLAQTYLLQLSYGIVKSEQAIGLAEPNIEKALNLNKELAEGHAVKGLMNWQISNSIDDNAKLVQLEKAKFHLTKAIELNPSNAEPYMWLATILQNQGDLADGSKLYKKSFEIDPQAAVVGFNYASDLTKQGRYQEAMNVFNSMVRNNPNYANAYQVAGNVSYAVGHLDQAFNMYKRQAELSGTENDWLLNSNRILIPLGYFDLAQENLDKIILQKNEKFIKAFPFLQAQIWIASDNISQLYQWTDSIDEDSKSWTEWLLKGLVATTKQQWEYAISDLEKSLILMRGDQLDHRDEMTIRIQLLLARAWQGLGDTIRSDSYLSEANLSINSLISQGVLLPKTLRYHQAAHAAISEQSLQALSLLRQTIQEGFVDTWILKVDPAFDSLREDPTYLAILREFDAKMRLMRDNLQLQESSIAQQTR